MNTRRKTSFRAPSFATLLVVLLLLLLLPPLLPALPEMLLEIAFDLVLVAGVVSAGGAGKHRVPLGVLTVVTLASRWLDLTQHSISFSILSSVLTFSWITYTTIVIVSAILKERDVSGNTIMGAIVTYLLAALAFTIVYALLVQLSPGAIEGLGHGTTDQIFRDCLYFSLISITTMGYGDIVPVSQAARMIASIEGVFGQLYLAVMIARLVGLHIASGRD